MTKPRYPVHLDLEGRKVLVVGAGRVATRKILRLAEAGAALSVVALHASAPVRKLAHQARLTYAEREARHDDVTGSFMVIAATDDPAVNARVATWARRENALVSRVDAPDESDFTVPALVQGQHVEATVSTYGDAPSASRRLKRELETWVAEGPERFAREVAAVRRALHGHPAATARLRELNDSGLFEACRAGDEARIRTLVDAALRDVSQAALHAGEDKIAPASQGLTHSPSVGERR